MLVVVLVLCAVPAINGDFSIAQQPAVGTGSAVTVAPSAGSPTAGIQEAINALGRDGGAVTIPPGEYLLRQAIHVRSNVTLEGTGANTVLRRGKQVEAKLAAVAEPGSISVQVESAAGLREGDEVGIFDQASVGWHHAHAIVKGIQGNELRLDRMLGRKFDPARGATVINYFPAITAVGASKVVIKDLTIDGRRDENPGPSLLTRRGEPFELGFTFAAIHLVGVTDSRIEGSRIVGWPTDGISVQRGGNDSVVRCVVENCRGHGYHPGGGLHDSEFSEIVAQGNDGDGLYFCANVERVVVKGSRFIGNKGNGVGGLGDVGDLHNLVENNLCEGNGASGILLTNGGHNTVKNNTCLDNSRSLPGHFSGISLVKTTESVVSGNRSFDSQETKTQKHGIAESADSRGNVFATNDCRGNAHAGLALAGEDGRQDGNVE
ncbi:MAG: hypothetical protein A2138_03790 [Deltaproteobacteria bacterium RBG_16_71_12]|nr:MAG: hypothetical protein A2138_03790 [Deltaproteobacteria bacterium RBG_16_71_12]